jgi:hypothetical protein
VHPIWLFSVGPVFGVTAVARPRSASSVTTLAAVSGMRMRLLSVNAAPHRLGESARTQRAGQTLVGGDQP